MPVDTDKNTASRLTKEEKYVTFFIIIIFLLFLVAILTDML